LAFFSNGWQSWSFSGALGANDSHPDTRLGIFAAPMWFNPGTPRLRKPGHFSSDMFGVLGDRQHRSGILAGFLSQKEQFGSLEACADSVYPALALWANGDQVLLEPGTQITTDWAVIQFVDIDAPDPLRPYLEAVAREHNLSPSISGSQSSIGWCSWYQFYQDISEENIRKNLASASALKNDLPFDLFQIDDGFQAQVGDWLEFAPTFPNGIAPLAESIQQVNLSPGLWLAPFIMHSKAKIKSRHPNWLLRNRFGLYANAGFVWDNFNKGLDLTHPQALDYVKNVIRTAVHRWGFQFLKLDFLFAAAIKGRFQDRTKTRAQVLRTGLEAVREEAGPDVHLLGCGVPLGPSIGIFDSMRIGADVDPHWQPTHKGVQALFRNEYAMPSTCNAIQNALTRAFMHRRWWINDPDCLLVRPESHLTLEEVHSLATVIALSGGPILLSDDLTKLPPERLQIVRQLVPLIGKRPRVMDWFDAPTPRLLRLDLANSTGKWHLLGIFNWDEKERDLSLSLEKFDLSSGEYLAREFWSGETARISNGELILNGMPVHSTRLLALRPIQPARACYLGSDLHISQGLEVTTWSESATNFRIRLERTGKAAGQVDLYLPKEPERITLNRKDIIYQSLAESVYRLSVEFENVAEIEIR
jgi:alpha-galactosidase